MSQYDAVAQRSLATITKKGAAVVFPTAGGTQPTYDPATDTWSGGSSSSVTGRAVQIDGDPDRWKTLSLILVNPVTLMIAASGLSITPAIGMTFMWPESGTTYTIRDKQEVAPDGTPIIYVVTGSAG
jgi:hypothetical protein